MKITTSNKVLVISYCPLKGFSLPLILTPLQRAKDSPILLALTHQLRVPSVSAAEALLGHFLIFAHFPSAKAWRGFHRLICLIFVEHLLLFVGLWGCTGGDDAAPAFEKLILWVGDRLDIVGHYTLTEEN